MAMGFAPTWLRQVSPLLHMTTLTTGQTDGRTAPTNEPETEYRMHWVKPCQWNLVNVDIESVTQIRQQYAGDLPSSFHSDMINR